MSVARCHATCATRPRPVVRKSPSRRAALAAALATLVTAAVLAQEPATRSAPGPRAAQPAVPEAALATITVRKLDARLRFLTTNLLEGRVVGHRGNEIAEVFLASEFERLGLKGVEVSKDGAYYQPFEMVGSTRAAGNRLVIREGAAGQEAADAYEIGPDLSPMNFSPIKEASGNLLFAGYGVTAPNIEYDDYQGVDANGRIVIVLDGVGTLGLTDVSATTKVANAQAHGAAGILVIAPLRAALDGSRVWPEKASPKVNRFSLPGRAENTTIPAANISVKLAGRLLGGGRSIPDVMKEFEARRTPASLEIQGKHATLAVNLNRRRVTVRNIVAMAEGTDPRLKSELVVVGGHFDANGIDDKGLIYTGADDNASGATAVLAIAEAFARAAELGARPRRTVVFAAWNAEEKGRGGSTYYVGHPVPEWGTVVVNINLDHVGRNEENVDQSDPRFLGFPLMSSRQNANVLHLLGYSYCPDVAKVVMEENRAIGLDVREDYDQHVSNLVQRSDHWSFLSKGIPAIFLHTGLHPDYHMPTDTIEKINFPKFAKITKLGFRVAWRLATQAERPQPPRTRTGAK